MIDRYTKVLLTVIAVNLTVMVGWGAVKMLVPEVRAEVAEMNRTQLKQDSDFRYAVHDIVERCDVRIGAHKMNGKIRC